MFAPVRQLASIRPSASPGVLAAAAVVTGVFAATPFLVPTISTELGVSLGTAGLVSTAQVAGYAVATFLAGRVLTPSRALLVGAGVLSTVANVASAVADPFALLVLTRAVAGIGMGIATWIAWADATRHPRGIGDVAATGPVTSTLASPVLAWIAEVGGHRMVYLALAVLTALPTVLRSEVVANPPVGRTVSGSKSNRLLLGALMLLAFSGSALFVFVAVAGARAGLSPVVVSIGFSLNAMCGVFGTRVSAPAGRGWLWFMVVATSAAVTGLTTVGVVWLLAMAVWGFSFWVAVPVVFRLLAEKSLRPDERVGDAQSLMGLGRVFGPAIGGAVLGADRFLPLTVLSVAGMVTCGAVTGGVESRRRAPSG
jgi:DHA1 family inner membrane transport protein